MGFLQFFFHKNVWNVRLLAQDPLRPFETHCKVTAHRGVQKVPRDKQIKKAKFAVNSCHQKRFMANLKNTVDGGSLPAQMTVLCTEYTNSNIPKEMLGNKTICCASSCLEVLSVWKTFSGDFSGPVKKTYFSLRAKKILLTKFYGLGIGVLVSYWDIDKSTRKYRQSSSNLNHSCLIVFLL